MNSLLMHLKQEIDDMFRNFAMTELAVMKMLEDLPDKKVSLSEADYARIVGKYTLSAQQMDGKMEITLEEV